MATINENLDKLDEIKSDLKDAMSSLGYNDIPFSQIGSTMKAVIPELTSETASALTSIEVLSNDVLSISSSIDIISNDVGNTLRSINAIQLSVSSISSATTSALTSINSITSDIDSILSSINIVLGSIDNALLSIGSNASSISNLSADALNLSSSISTISVKVEPVLSLMNEVSSLIDEVSSKMFIKGEDLIYWKDVADVEVIDGTNEINTAISNIYDKYIYVADNKLQVKNNSGYNAFILSVEPGTLYTFNRSARFVCQFKDTNHVIKYEQSILSTEISDDVDFLAVSYSTTTAISNFLVCKGLSLKPTAYTVPEWIDRNCLGDSAYSAYESIDRIDKQYARIAGKNLFDECKLLSTQASIDTNNNIGIPITILDLSSTALSIYNTYRLKVKKNTDYTFIAVRYVKRADIHMNQVGNAILNLAGQTMTTVNSGEAEYLVFTANTDIFRENYAYIINEGGSLSVESKIEGLTELFGSNLSPMTTVDHNLTATCKLFKPLTYVYNSLNGYAQYKIKSTYNTYIMPIKPGMTYTLYPLTDFMSLLCADMLKLAKSLYKAGATITNDISAPYLAFSCTRALSNCIISEGDAVTRGQSLNGLDFLSADLMYNVQANFNLTPHFKIVREGALPSVNANKLVEWTTNAAYTTYLVPIDGKSVYSSSFSGRAVLLTYDKKSPVSENISFNVSSSIDTNVPYARYMLVATTVGSSLISNETLCRGTKLISSKEIEEIEPLTSMKYAISSLNDKLINVEGNAKPKFSQEYAGLLLADEALQLSNVSNTLKKNWRICASFRSDDLSSVIIGRDTGLSSSSNFFEFSISSLKYYSNVSATPLTMSLDFGELSGISAIDGYEIILEKNEESKCKATVVADGNLISGEFNNYIDYGFNNWYIKPNACNILDIKFTWYPQDICKKTWMFGDSWFSFSTARWPYWLWQYGYSKNALIDGYPGEDTNDAVRSFKNLLQFGTPKNAILFTGMNDKTDPSDTTPSTSWTPYKDEFINVCQDNMVTPIFVTIPSTPTLNHKAKNAWIRASGYRYIDFEKAVGADLDTHWYPGMQNIDFPDTLSGNHPTAKGAKALFALVLIDYPEIMDND